MALLALAVGQPFALRLEPGALTRRSRRECVYQRPIASSRRRFRHALDARRPQMRRSASFDRGQKVRQKARAVDVHADVGIVQGDGGPSPIGDRLPAGELSAQPHVDEHPLRSGQL